MSKQSTPQPPRLAIRLLRWFCAPHLIDEMEGDLNELFQQRVETVGLRRARWRYVRDMLSLIRPFIIKRKPNEYPNPSYTDMLRNYLTIALRNLVRQKVNTGINLLGLAVGLSSFLLIGLYISYEMAYDRHHGERIYRMVADRNYTNGEQKQYATTPTPLAPLIQQELPGVQLTTRVLSPQWTTQKVLVTYGSRRFYEGDVLFADSAFFSVFRGYSFVVGDAQTALKRPGTVVISRRAAQKYFGNQNPVGKKLRLYQSYEVEVTGVLGDARAPSHLQADFIASFDIVKARYGDLLSLWGWDLVYTYLVLDDHTQPSTLLAKLPGLLEQHLPNFKNQRGYAYEFALQPLQDIHLHSDRQWEVSPNSKALYIKVLGFVALLILLVSAINAINLQLARLTTRLKEVGVRRVLGASRVQLPLQLLTEAGLLIALALGLSAVITIAWLPLLERLTGQHYSLGRLVTGPYRWGVVGSIVGMGLVLGLVPARFIGRLNLVVTLKKGLLPNTSFAWVRKGLVISQFTASVFLLIASLILYRQLQFWQTKPLGFDNESILIVKGYGSSPLFPVLKQAFLSVKGVERVAATSGLPGSNIEKMRVIWEGQTEPRPVDMLWIDEDFITTLGIRLAAGRNFSTRYGTDSTRGYLINETAARSLGWTQPLGKYLQIGGPAAPKGQIVGIIRDVHHTSLHKTVEPLVLQIRPDGFNVLAVRVHGPIGAVLEEMAARWKQLVPDKPFEYDFLDQQLARQYQREVVFGQVMGVFTGLAIFIACLGLFSLATLTAEQRTKEIGVRKVLGASVSNLVMLFLRDLVILVLVAIALASPLAWWTMHQWLQSFAYHAAIEWWIFPVAGAVAIAVALLTVSFQAIKAALVNPVKSLRTE